MKKMKYTLTIINILLVMCGLLIIGCSGSEEASKEKTPPPVPSQPSATEMMQTEMNRLKITNDSLRQQIFKLGQENRTTVARSAELETQLSELKERLASIPPPAPKPVITNTHEAYDKSLTLFRSRNYQEAASTLQGILDAGSAGNLESNCHYWLGECSYATKNYKGAIEHFQKVFGYSRTSKKDDAQIMIANCYMAMGNKATAKAEYQKLIEKYPASPYAKRAKAKLGRL